MATSNAIRRLSAMDTATIHEAGAGMIMDGTIRLQAGTGVCGPALTVLSPPGDNLMIHLAVAQARRGAEIAGGSACVAGRDAVGVA